VSCQIDFETLVAYWAHDLPEAENDALEEHLFACDACTAVLARVAALAYGVSRALPPFVRAHDVERLHAHGGRTAENEFLPGETKVAVFTRDADVLLHRLACDLSRTQRLEVEIQALDGTTLQTFEDVPFDAEAGAVLVACQRHLLALERFATNLDMNFVVRRCDADGAETVDTYGVLHRLE